jgi:hypothetical protein
LLVATQNVLAVHTAAIPISPDADIDTSAGSAPAIDINVDPGAPVGSIATAVAIDIDIHVGTPVRPVSVAAPPTDVDVDIAALLRSCPVTAPTLVTWAHLCAMIPFILR